MLEKKLLEEKLKGLEELDANKPDWEKIFDFIISVVNFLRALLSKKKV